MENNVLPKDYIHFLKDMKERIRQARAKAIMSVNYELIMLYWHIGKSIIERQKNDGWGTKVIEILSGDLQKTFPETKGFSIRNLKYMRALALAYPEKDIVQQLVAQISWSHNIRLLDTVKDKDEREWYIKQTALYGWSRNVMLHQIETDLYRQKTNALSNFKKTLPQPQSDLAHELMKDTYTFDFLGMKENISERELEMTLIENIRAFLLELGMGFSFVGSQYNLKIGGQDYYIDLLFYHIPLRCYLVLEIKTGQFKPEYAGKMNFYLSAIDESLCNKDDNPSIGLILCKTKNRVIAEYALRDTNKPMSIASYRTVLPTNLKNRLPEIDVLENELNKI